MVHNLVVVNAIRSQAAAQPILNNTGNCYLMLLGTELRVTETHTHIKHCLIGPKCTVKEYRYRRFNGRCTISILTDRSEAPPAIP
ncbi:hypothetical protein RP20_CCG018180 [Aedes albopictus]|nr:hypothetical protein RP20_CCG018180 [Aedes albopictus]